MKPHQPTHEWRAVPDGSGVHLLLRGGLHAATAWPNGCWADHERGRGGLADPPTLEAAKAAVEAELWAQAAEGLVQW